MPIHSDSAIRTALARLDSGQPLDHLHRTVAAATMRRVPEAEALLALLDTRLAALARDVPAAEREVTTLRSFIAEWLHGVD